jgi:hypothetical protein
MVEPTRRRKPLRRTAWSLFIGGLVMTGLMVGIGLLLLAGGKDIGPGQTVVWPAGERASVHKDPGPQKDESESKCERIGAEGPDRWLEWADSVRSPTEVTIRCHQDAIFLTGTPSAVTSALQSPLITAPVGVALLGLMLFVPRLMLAMAELNNGRRGWATRWLGPRQ